MLVDDLEARVHALELTYDVDDEMRLAIALASLVTTPAMNWVQSGRYGLCRSFAADFRKSFQCPSQVGEVVDAA